MPSARRRSRSRATKGRDFLRGELAHYDATASGRALMSGQSVMRWNNRSGCGAEPLGQDSGHPQRGRQVSPSMILEMWVGV